MPRLRNSAGEMLIQRCHARASIDHEQADVRLIYGCLGLLAHTAFERALRGIVQAGRVDDGETQIRQPCLALAPVPRDTRQIVDQRQALAGQTIEQRRFADIGPADYCDG